MTLDNGDLATRHAAAVHFNLPDFTLSALKGFGRSLVFNTPMTGFDPRWRLGAAIKSFTLVFGHMHGVFRGFGIGNFEAA
jgi:hypothetical protein